MALPPPLPLLTQHCPGQAAGHPLTDFLGRQVSQWPEATPGAWEGRWWLQRGPAVVTIHRTEEDTRP